MDPLAPNQESDLLDAFRSHYFRYETIVREAITLATDSTVLARIGDDLDEYSTLLAEVISILTTWKHANLLPFTSFLALANISPL